MVICEPSRSPFHISNNTMIIKTNKIQILATTIMLQKLRTITIPSSSRCSGKANNFRLNINSPSVRVSEVT
jgi:hypothetical protein